MGSSERPALYTIEPWRPFAHDLAAGLLARFPDPLQLARILLILPTRRAVRAASDAFVAQSAGKALLLPRMAPAGDMDADEALGSFAEGLEGPAEVLAEVTPTYRLLALAKILASAQQLSATEALAMAGQLAAALDVLEIEGKRAQDIDDAVPEGLLEGHWSRNAEVLKTLQRVWPDILAARGRIDSSARRNILLNLLADRWAAAPPATPVIMAGFAAAPPALARLAGVVARLPAGMLVMPGLDRGIGPELWQQIDEGLETHPQFGMARLLRDARVSPAEAETWPESAGVAGSLPVRAELARLAMQPAELGGERLQPAPPGALAGVRMAEAANPAEEALVIALALRQILDHPGRKAALVTPDRALAEHVRTQLRRFGIVVDDSAGQPLATTPAGSLFVQIAAAAGERFAPVALLALLQHPLVQAGEGRLAWLNNVRRLDRIALRGLRPRPGLAGVAARLKDDLKDWWQEQVTPLLAPVEPLPRDARALLNRLRVVAEALAGPALWEAEGGKALAALIETLDESAEDLAELHIAEADAGAFTSALLARESVRSRWGLHPQLAIWGPLEARLQHADLLIMGGLNEGTWPALPAPDPFLAPAIRRALGLPGLARRTGLQAHDFAAGMGAAEVLLTRSARSGGTPQVASRFWQRLAAVAGAPPDGEGLIPSGKALLAKARELRRASTDVRIPQPQPAPPASVRPRQIRVTDVAMLKADPFSFYAKYVLGLRRLDPRDAEPTGGDRGQVVHDILQRMAEPDAPPLAEIMAQALAPLGDRPEVAALWQPRVERMLDFVQKLQAREPEWVQLAAETAGRLKLGEVELIGRADRVDQHRDDPRRYRIVDYKTGTLPRVKDVAELWQTQLGLLGVMAAAGRLDHVPPGEIGALDYIKLSGGTKPGERKSALGSRATAEDIEQHLSAAIADLEELAHQWLLGDRPFTAKLSMVRGRAFRDYDHLARVAEWLGR